MTHGTDCLSPESVLSHNGFPEASTLLLARLIAGDEQVMNYFWFFCPHEIQLTQTFCGPSL